VFEDQTFILKAGEYTQPIRTKQGFVIFKVTEHTPGGVQPLKDVEPQVEDALYSQKMAPALRQYLTKLREESYVDIKQGYEDAGASPNESKPVYSAYTPPTGKKKKHVERTRFRQKSTAKPAATQTASAPAPSNVPSLADVPQSNATQTASTEQPATASTPTAPAPAAAPAPTNSQVASAGTEKPGKKEKIRFGQAPRETLPSAQTKTEDAGATGTQVAANNVPQNMQVVGPDGAVDNQPTEEKKEKTRFAARAKEPKQKKSKDKTDPFAPSPESSDEVATRQEQSTPLGLNGDTAKPVKAPKPTEKTRLADKAKEKEPPKPEPVPNPEGAPATRQQTPSAPVPTTAPAAPATAPAPATEPTTPQ
jgi:peptidyl-prolyl cis-trans isomerase SurA